MINKTKKQKTPSKKRIRKKGKKKDSLIPLLIILIILLSLTSFMAFSDKSSFITDLFSKNNDNEPLIERPRVEQIETVKTENNEENSYIVTTETEIKANPETPVEVEKVDDGQKTIKSRLFFVKVSDEGQISLKSVIRPVHYNTAPLTRTIESLIQGPERSELNKGLLNLIPQNSVLISIKISKGTAFLNFNDDFQFNSLGIEGYKAQLMQIVYTATEFQTVDNVQILINGEISDYLGAEGLFIGDPMDREYFNTF